MSERRWMEVAAEAAREAGKILSQRFQGHLEVAYKGENELVTDADLTAQERIVEVIRSAYPHHAILSEEMERPQVKGGQPLWIVDPLDGTTNYWRRWPCFSVSVAVSQGERLMAGAVYDPSLDELFQAYLGGGAYMNGVSLRVSPVDSLDKALLAMNWPYDREAMAQALEILGRLMPRVLTMRSIGSAALSLCYIAAGRADLYFHPRLKAWDAAAGGLILKEAGGTLTDFSGNPWALRSPQCLGTSGQLFEEALRLISGG